MTSRVIPSGAGTISVSERQSETTEFGWSKAYRAEATANGGYVFDHFEYSWNYSTSYESSSGTENNSENPLNGYIDYFAGSFCEWDYDYSSIDLDFFSRQYITEVVAVFRESIPIGSVTVTTEADPIQGGNTSPESETKTGDVGTSVQFNLVAITSQGWKFVKWMDDNGTTVSRNPSVTVSKVIQITPQTYKYTAKFIEVTGEILHGDSGAIIHGSGGTILFKG